MKKKLTFLIGLQVTLLLVIACSLSGGGANVEEDVLSAGVTATISVDQATQAPTSTNTKEPTETSTPTDTPEPEYDTGSTVISEKDDMTLVYVPEGDFEMGSDEFRSEQPIHTVYLDAYWIDRTEVTNAMFEKFIQETGHQVETEKEGGSFAYIGGGDWDYLEGADWRHPQGLSSSISGLEDHPVVQVNWNDVAAYCEWAGRRLPTEAEWEKAARGTDGRTYPWGNQGAAGDLLNFADLNLDADWTEAAIDDGYKLSAPVGSYADGASPYGAFDMAGNVWEWVADWYDEDYYSSSPGENPQGPSSGEHRLLRGGSWFVSEWNVRSAFRLWYFPGVAPSSKGFRCARGTSSP